MFRINTLNLKLEDENTFLFENENNDGDVDEDRLEQPLPPETDEIVKEMDDYSLVNESYNILDSISNNSDPVSIRDTIMYTCGRLGMSYSTLRTDISTESIELGLEGVLSNFKEKLVETLKAIWEKIKLFFSKIWIKVQAYYYDLTKNVFNVRKKIYGLQDKTDIIVSKSEMEGLFKLFYPYFTLRKFTGSETPKQIIQILTTDVSQYCSEVENSWKMSCLKELAKNMTEYNNVEEFRSKLISLVIEIKDRVNTAPISKSGPKGGLRAGIFPPPIFVMDLISGEKVIENV